MKRYKTYSAAWREWVAATTSLCFALQPAVALALPAGGVVSGGAAVITGDATSTTIMQASGRAVIDWSSFDVSQGEAVRFAQPDALSIAFNRIHDSNVSTIDGSLTANGNVWFSNAHGMVFGDHAQVNVGGLIATTADMDNNRFMAGGNQFDIPGDPDSFIRNSGLIKISDGGLAALVAPSVMNDGIIVARLGRVELASGETFTVDPYGDGLINLEVSDGVRKQLVEHTGIISADGGKVLLTAAAGKDTVDSLINMQGVIRARSIDDQKGTITLYAEGSNAVDANIAEDQGKKSGSSNVIVSGTINASGKNSGESGGTISVLGDKVGILNRSILDASGDIGGGTIKIGGDFHGEGNTPTALTTEVQHGALIDASALNSGNGGNVVVWSDEYTLFAGSIRSSGGANGGDGGFVETSGHQLLSLTDANGNTGMVYASSPRGNAGTWLLDPYNVTIGNVDNGNGTINGTNPSGTSQISHTTIETALNAGTNVTVTTGSTGSPGADVGDITVSSAINPNITVGTPTLKLSAYRNIILNAGIVANALGNALNVILGADNGNNSSGYINVAAPITSNGGAITMGGGSGVIATNSGFAWGNSGQSTGIIISGPINSGGGNVITNGHGANGANGGYSDPGGTGIFVTASGSISSAAGNINLTGTGGQGGTGHDGANNPSPGSYGVGGYGYRGGNGGGRHSSRW